MAALPPGTVRLHIFSWNARLARHVKAGQFEQTMDLFQQMQQEGMSPDKFTFLRVSMHVLVYKHLKRAKMSTDLSENMAVSQMSMWVTTSLTCMPNVGA